MGKRVTGESSEKKEDHPQESILRSKNSDDGVTETSVNRGSLTDDKPKVTGTSTTPPQPTMAEDAEEYIKPIIKDGEVILEVECGQNKALLYLSKLCQGSKGPCIYFQGSWLAPNEFQYVSGRETAKDWKRSIRHHGKSLKLLLAKGILSVHPTVCDCEGCRTGSTLNRNRNGTKKKSPVNKESKAKQTAEGVRPGPEDVNTTALPLSVSNGDKIRKDVKKIQRKSTDKAVSPLRESKSTNIMNSIPVSGVPSADDRGTKVPVVAPVPGQFQVPNIPVPSPVKPESVDYSNSVQAPIDQPIKKESFTDKFDTQPSPVKQHTEKYKPVEPKGPVSPVPSSKTDGCKNNLKKDDKSPTDNSTTDRPAEIIRESKHSTIENLKSSFEQNSEPSRSPSHDHPRKIQELESDKMTPKSIPGFVPRLSSDVPAFRLPETSADAALYADYMRMFTPGHLLPPVPQSIDPLYTMRASDPSYSHVLHPYHGCAIYNPHPSGLYPREQMLFPTTSGAMPSAIGSHCFTPLHMFSQRLPYTLSSPVLELPRSFGFMPSPSSMSYPCSGISGLKRNHTDLESSSDIGSKRLRLDYPVPDFRFDSYPSCSATYPSLYYDASMLQNEEYRRKLLEESMICANDIPSYLHAYKGYHCTCINRPGDIRNWSVEDVCSFISRLDGGSIYAETFREQRVDGKILPLLTTDHMMKSLGLKLGPAVLIAEAVAKKIQEARAVGCDGCRKLSLGTSVEM